MQLAKRTLIHVRSNDCYQTRRYGSLVQRKLVESRLEVNVVLKLLHERQDSESEVLHNSGLKIVPFDIKYHTTREMQDLVAHDYFVFVKYKVIVITSVKVDVM